MESYIGRSHTTGKYHYCYDATTTDCNSSGQVRSAANRKATDSEIARARDADFCGKCFSAGKPTTN